MENVEGKWQYGATLPRTVPFDSDELQWFYF